MLWLLFTGAITSTTSGTQRPWFAWKLHGVAMKAGIETWEGMKRVLEGFLWVEGVHEGRGRDLWEGRGGWFKC